jgi:hypothetical protein
VTRIGLGGQSRVLSTGPVTKHPTSCRTWKRPWAATALEVAPNVPTHATSGPIIRGWIVGRWPLFEEDPADYLDIEAPAELEARKWQAWAERNDPRQSPLLRPVELLGDKRRDFRDEQELDRRVAAEAARKRKEER